MVRLGIFPLFSAITLHAWRKLLFPVSHHTLRGFLLNILATIKSLAVRFERTVLEGQFSFPLFWYMASKQRLFFNRHGQILLTQSSFPHLCPDHIDCLTLRADQWCRNTSLAQTPWLLRFLFCFRFSTRLAGWPHGSPCVSAIQTSCLRFWEVCFHW